MKEINLNNNDHVKKIKLAGNTSQGQIIVDYLKYNLKRSEKKKIDMDKPLDKIGAEYIQKEGMEKCLRDIIKFLTS